MHNDKDTYWYNDWFKKLNTEKQKNQDDKQWYKNIVNHLDTCTSSHYNIDPFSFDQEENMENYNPKINYDLFNNILSKEDLKHVFKPYGDEKGNLPAKFKNRDIISGKIKVLLGMQESLPFNWKVIAVNPEATTRKEQEKAKLIQDYVIDTIRQPIREQIELEYAEELKNDKLTDQEKNEILQSVEQELEKRTPEEIQKYIERDYQDPAEILAHQLLQYIIEEKDIEKSINEVFKHGLLSSKSIMYCGIINNKLIIKPVNSLLFDYSQKDDIVDIQDCEWLTYEMRLNFSEVIDYFGNELTQDEIESISYNNMKYDYLRYNYKYIKDENSELNYNYNDSTIPVLHCCWKSLRKIGTLTFQDKDGNFQTMKVSDDYKVNKDTGETVEWEWIPQVYQCFKIGKDIYVSMKPVEGQLINNNEHKCKFPYVGVIYDSTNSKSTSLMDRLKDYQYYYNIIMFKLENILHSDKGKKILMNVSVVPDTKNMSVEKWMSYIDKASVLFYDPGKLGNGYTDVNSIAKTMDLSLISDIQKYIQVAEYIKVQCGKSVGITEQTEGQIGQNEAVTNAQQSLVQSSYILKPYFKLHDRLKKNLLEYILDISKIYYSDKSEKLTYVLDDMSQKILEIDGNLLSNSSYGIYVSNSASTQEIKDVVNQAVQAGIQNGLIQFSDIITISKLSNINEIQEQLILSENKLKNEKKEEMERQHQQNQENMIKQEEINDKNHQYELEKIRVKGEEDRKTALLTKSIEGASFNPDVDKNNNNKNDFLELSDKKLT